MSIYQGSNENLTFDEDLKLVYPETNIKDIKGFTFSSKKEICLTSIKFSEKREWGIPLSEFIGLV